MICICNDKLTTGFSCVQSVCKCVDLCAVSRIKAKGDLYEMDLLLDVNTDLYPMDVRKFAAEFSAS
jgi:RNA polymerase Rpb8